MTQNKSLMKKFAVGSACGALLATAFCAGRLSVNEYATGVQRLPISRHIDARESLSNAPLAFDFALPIEDVSTDDGQVFSFFMGFAR